MSEIHAELINPTDMLYIPTRESLDKLGDTHSNYTSNIYLFFSVAR